MPLATRAHANRGRGPMSVPNQYSWNFANKSNFSFTGATQSMDTGQGMTSLNGVAFTCGPSAKDGTQVLKAAGTAYCLPTSPASEMICYVSSWVRWDDTAATTNRISMIINSWSTNNAGTADSSTHYGFGYTSAGGLPGTLYPAVVQLVTNGGGFATIGGTWSESGAGLGNWFRIEWVINPSNNTWVGRMPDGTTRSFVDANLTDAVYQGLFPSWEPFYGGGFTTGDVDAEMLDMKASTLGAMTLPHKRYCNKLLRRHSGGEIAPVPPPSLIVAGTPLFFDFTGLSNTTGLTGLPAGWAYPNAGSSRGMHINSALAVGASFGNYGNSSYRTDWVFEGEQQRVTLAVGEPMNTKSWLQQAIIHAAATGGLQGWFGNSQVPTIYAESALGGSGGSPGTSRAAASLGTNYNGTSDYVSAESYGRVKILRYNGLPVLKWFDSGSLTTVGAGNRLPAFALESDADGKGVGSVKFESMGANGYSPSKITKNATPQTITTSFATITGWAATDTAATAYTSNTVTVPGFTTILSGNGFQVIAGGAPVVTLTASVPYTGLSGGGSNKVRIMKNGTQVGSDGGTQSGASGTCTCTVSGLTVAPEDVITVQITGSAGTPGSVTASTPTLTLT